jgi:hypothetical protein
VFFIARDACLFSLFIRRIQAGDVAVKIGQIMLLPATRIDDGARLHEAIQ